MRRKFRRIFLLLPFGIFTFLIFVFWFDTRYCLLVFNIGFLHSNDYSKTKISFFEEYVFHFSFPLIFGF